MANQLVPSVLDSLRSLDSSRRFMLAGGVVGAIVFIAVVTMWAAEPTYVTLFHDLPLRESGRVAEQLDQAGISYRLAMGGTAVEVANNDAPRARVLLAQQGLPATERPGLELFDKPTWGMTDFSQRVTYRRALEGELGRTIATLRGVRGAQVHLALHEASPLRRLERPAEAAVVLELDGGALNPDVVQGIVHIVSNSVEQLSSEHVAVMDDSGRLLSVPSDGNSMVGLTSRQLDVQRSIEGHLSDKVESLLATVVGPGAAKAQITARLNFEQVDRTIESFDPDAAVIENEQRSETEAPAGGGGAQTVVNNQFQNSRTIERIVGSGGGITRLTVAVLIDEQVFQAAGRQFATERGQLESLIQSAVGFDRTRGDQLTVIAQPFSQASVEELTGLEPTASPGLDPMALIQQFTRPVLGLLGILAAFLLGLKAIRSMPTARSESGGGTLAPAAAGTGTAALTDGAASGMLPLEPTPENLKLRNALQAESVAQPEVAAQVVKAWLAES